MNKMSGAPETGAFFKDICKMMAALRNDSDRPVEDVEDLLSNICSYLFLIWAESEDREQHVVEGIDIKDYGPLIPESLSPRHWLGGDVKEFHSAQFETISYLRRSRNPMASWVNEVIKEDMIGFPQQAHNHDHYHIELLVDLLKRCLSGVNVSTPNGRLLASQHLEGLIAVLLSHANLVSNDTPKPVVDLMVELANPQPGESIYDPCFGMGGLLLACSQRVAEATKSMAAVECKRLQNKIFFGAKRKDQLAYCIATTRIALAATNHPRLHLTDSLDQARSLNDQQFDIVLACPPWGRHIFAKDRIKNYRVQSNDASNLFLQHTMESLRPGGRAIIAVPQGTLFQLGSDKKIRKILLEEFHTEGVISLPEGAFAPLTGIKSSLLLFRKQKPKPKVRFLVVGRLEGTQDGSVIPAESPKTITERFRSVNQDNTCWDTLISDLANRDWGLVPKPTGAEALEKELNAICKASNNTIKLNPLEKIVTLFTGLPFKRQMIVPKRYANTQIGLIRTADIKDGRVIPPEMFLNESGAQKVMDMQFLQPNDILISTSGTIGNIALVPSNSSLFLEGYRYVADRSLVVIRPSKSVFPEFIVKMLNSETYQNWMSGHASGSAVQHLSASILRHLPFLVPDLNLQKRIAHDFQQPGLYDKADGIESILVDVSSEDCNYKIQVAAKKLIRESVSIMKSKSKSPLHLLEKSAALFYKDHKNDEELPELYDWKEFPRWWYDWHQQMCEALENVADISSMNAGPAQYAILQETLGLFRNVEHWPAKMDDEYQVDIDELKIVTELRQFTVHLEYLLELSLKSLLEQVDLKATLYTTTIPTEKETDISASITNIGALPLRSVVFATEPIEFGKGKTSILEDSEVHKFALTIPAQLREGKLPFKILWKGKRLDGKEISDAIDLEVHVQSSSDLQHMQDLGASPYIAGPPINCPEMFFGRNEVISQIKRQLSMTNRANVLLLEGNRRTGKTSILKHLGSGDVLQGWIPVYCSFQGVTGDESLVGLPTAQVFKVMAIEIFKTVADKGYRVWFPDEEMPDISGLKYKAAFIKAANVRFASDNPFDTFRLFLEAVLKAVEPHRLLLMLDEFDKLQEGIESGVTSPQIPDNLRYLLHEYSNLSAILSYPRLRDLQRHQYWSTLFGLGYTIGITALDSADAKRLVTEPAKEKLVYGDKAVERIVDYCAGQPFLIQKLCNHVFDLAATSQERSIANHLVVEAVKIMAMDDEHFATLWQYHVRTERQRYILTLAVELQNSPDDFNIRLLEIKLEEVGIQIRRHQQIGDDLEFLCKLELLHMENEGAKYHLAIPLMGEWIRFNIDFEHQKRRSLQENEEELR